MSEQFEFLVRGFADRTAVHCRPMPLDKSTCALLDREAEMPFNVFIFAVLLDYFVKRR